MRNVTGVKQEVWRLQVVGSGAEWLAQQFELNRGHLRAVAYRMLGSVSEAEDAVQEAWLRLSRADGTEIDNLGGWLTTVVSRICLDSLRARSARREEPIDGDKPEPIPSSAAAHTAPSNPEQEAVMADSVGLALMVVLDRLAPAERLAFVLHDLFAVPFEEVGRIVGRSAAAARQLASRARRRVRGVPVNAAEQLRRQRALVDQLLAALRAGDVEGIVAVLDPEFVIRVDEAAMVPGGQREVHGARTWAGQAVAFNKGARAAVVALLDGAVGVVVAPRGRLFRALRVTFGGDKITAIEVIGDKERLAGLEVGVLPQ